MGWNVRQWLATKPSTYVNRQHEHGKNGQTAFTERKLQVIRGKSETNNCFVLSSA